MTCPAVLARLLIATGIARMLPGLQRRLEGGADYLRFWSDRLLVSPLEHLERIASAMQPDTPEVIDLASAAPRFDLAPMSTSTRLPADRRGWPPAAGLPELRGAVAAHLLAETHLTVSPAEEILITAGALGAAQIVFDAFVNRGDAVVMSDPVAPLYPLLARTRGARIRWVSSRVEDGRLRLRFDHLTRRLRHARLLVLNSPASPTGGILAPEDIEQIAWWADRYDVLVLSDEVYDRFAYDAETTSIATLPRGRPRTLTIGSLSKSHGLAHARVGWIAAYRHLLRACQATAALRCPFVPTLSQNVALAALQTSAMAFAPQRAQFEARRRYAHDRLRALGMAPVWPAGGLFLWVPLPEGMGNARSFADLLLTTRRVRVLPGDLFGPSGNRHIRISLAGDEGRLEEGLSRLGDLTRGERPARPGLWRVAA